MIQKDPLINSVAQNNSFPGILFPQIVQVFVHNNLNFRPAVQKDLQHPLFSLSLVINFVLVVVIVNIFLFLFLLLVITGLGDLVYEEDCGPGLLKKKTFYSFCEPIVSTQFLIHTCTLWKELSRRFSCGCSG